MSNGSEHIPERTVSATHRMRVTVSESDGLAAEPICVAHNPDSCPVREAFFWDPPASMEDYRGAALVLAEFPIEVTEISENGWYWRAEANAAEGAEREELFKLWLRHGSSFESDHSEGYELADALLAAGWRKESR